MIKRLLCGLMLLGLCGASKPPMAVVPATGGQAAIAAYRANAVSYKAPHFHYHVVAYDQHHRVAWTRDATNLVTTEGCQELINQMFKAGTTSTYYIGLVKSTPTFVIADTMASHAGWTEEATSTTDITNATRPALTLGSITGTSTVAADNSGSVAAFTINNTLTISGFYLVSNNTVGGITGKLYGEASFTAAPVAAGYTLNVTVTVTMAAA